MKKTLILFVCNLFLMNLFAGARDGGPSTIVQNTCPQNTQEAHSMRDIFYITAGNTTFQAEFAGNSSAEAFKALLAKGDLTITMSDYGNFEKVGNLGTTLPRNDRQITTSPGDIILYQGNSITIYYDTNTWSFTRLGKINGVTREQLLAALGKGSIRVTFSLERP